MITYRPAREEDLDETYEVMVDANEDLNRRLGHPVDMRARARRHRAMAVRRSILASDPGRFWVAESEVGMEGFGMAIRRDDVWHLASLQVRPRAQSTGAGRGLVERMLDDGAGRPRVWTTVSEAATEVSNGLYGRFGMFPQVPVIALAGPPGPGLGVSADGDGGSGAWVAAEGGAPSDLVEVDRAAIEQRRDADHACWGGIPGLRRVVLRRDGQVRAYAYVDDRGFIGPAAGLDEPDLVAVVAGVLRAEAEAGRERVTIHVPGVARVLLRALLGAGFRYQRGMNLVLSSGPFGRLDRYVISGSDSLF